jgi:hypothetical protein
MLEKLNMQAVISASANETEYVKDSLIEFEKVIICEFVLFWVCFINFYFEKKTPVLVHELIAMELWTEKIFSQLSNIGFKPKNSFIIYLIVIFFVLK